MIEIRSTHPSISDLVRHWHDQRGLPPSAYMVELDPDRYGSRLTYRSIEDEIRYGDELHVYIHLKAHRDIMVWIAATQDNQNRHTNWVKYGIPDYPLMTNVIIMMNRLTWNL